MKTIMVALTAAALLAGVAPASAETDVEMIAEELAKVAGPEVGKFMKERRFVPRELDIDDDKPSFGSQDWWREIERDQRGPRR